MAVAPKRKLTSIENCTEPKVPKLITTNFGPSFRKRLKTEHAISALNEFLEGNKERDVVTEYIDAGGSAKELVNLLKQHDGRNNALVANTVLSALECVVFKCNTDLLLIQKNVEEACEELLCNYQGLLQNMLSSHTTLAKHRKVVLKLFTGMVNLSNGLAKRFLTQIQFSVKTIKNIADMKSGIELRTAFIHYLLSFLVDDNVVLISELLQKRGLLTSIISGLMNDEPETIVLVLNTLRLKIVENIKISKTLKLHTFNTPVLRSLEKLYDYSISTDEPSEDHEIIASIEQTVKEAAHWLLMTLCTSHKKGILFKERTTGAGKSPNQLIFTLLENMKTPWKCQLRSELVTEILKMCPEFMKNIFQWMDPFIQPSASQKWVNLMNFTEQMIQKQDFTPENIDEKQTMNFITSLIFPFPLQKLLRELNDQNIHSHVVIRFHTMSLIHCMLSKIKKILDYCVETCHQENLISSLELQIDHFLNKHLIPSLHILNAYKCGITITTEESDLESTESCIISDQTKYLTLAADLLLLYSHLTPLNFNQLRVTEGIDFSCEIQNGELSFKIAQLMFQIYNPKPGQDQFAFMMKQFLQCYITDTNFHQDDVIQSVLLATGFFDGFEEEIIIWLNCIRNTTAANSIIVSDLVTSTLCTLGKKHKKFHDDLTTVSSYDEGSDVSGPDASLFVEEHGDLLDFGDEFESVASLPVKLSPMVPAFLFTLKTFSVEGNTNVGGIREFVSSVLVHLLHAQCTCYGLAVLVDKYGSIYISKNFLKYLNFWKNLKTDIFNPSTIPDAATQLVYRNLVLREDSMEEILSFISEATELDCILLWNTCLFYTIQLEKKHNLSTETITSIISILDSIAGKLETQSTLCLKLMLTNHRFINGFTVQRGSIAYTEILLKTVSLFQRHEIALKYCSKFLSSYRLKFMLNILDKLRVAERIKISCQSYSIQDMVKFVNLNGKHVVELLKKLLRLPTNLLINEKQTKLSEWSILLKCLLDEAAKNLDDALNQEDFNLLICKIIEILRTGVSSDDIDESVISYLTAFPHHIDKILDDDIENLLNHHRRVNKLVVFLIQYHPSHLNTLQSKLLSVKNLLDDVPLLFDILNKIQAVGEIRDEVLSQIYKSQICDPIRLLKNDYSWLSSSKDLIVKILRQFAERKTCSKICQTIESEWPELQVDADKFQILRVPFEKAKKIDSLIQLSLSKFNQLLASGAEVNWLCELIIELVNLADDLEFLPSSDLWKEYVKLSLKYGLQFANPSLIRTLRISCAKIFQNESSAEESSLIFQMTISHSEFINIMLGDSEVKCDLVEFLIALTAVNKSLMSSNHVPLLFGSYKATLSKCDQSIFQLLCWYEDNGIRFSDCRPFLWGDAAVTHHSIRTEISVSLKRQPLPNQVLDLLDSEIIKNTIRHFPLDRSTKPSNQYIEYEHKMYDLSFMLPLMSHLLAPESHISVQKFTRSGALSLILCALSSELEDVRMAAYHCLQRFRAHLFSHEKEIKLWEHFMNALQNGITSSLSENQEAPRLPCIVTTFLAQMSLIIGEPLHPLYISLTNFLLAKPTFDIHTVPNFLMLFYSTDEKNKDQQEWILNVIKFGLRYKSDWVVSQKCFLFKLLLQYSFSSISNESTNALILDILVSALRIPESRQNIVTKYGFLSWIAQVISSININHKALVPLIIEILGLLISVKNSIKITFIVLQFLYKINDLRIENNSLEKLLGVLAQAYGICKIKNIIDRDTVELIITVSTPLLRLESVKKYRNCLKYKSPLVLEKSLGKVDEYVISILKCHLQNQQ